MSLIDRFLRPDRTPGKETSAKATSAWAEVDDKGRLVLPPEIATDFGLRPGARVRLDRGEHHFRVHRPVTQLNKVYIEPTVACNLDCITCFRNEWENPMGRMSDTTFARVLDGLKALDPVPDVYFGGIGEPLYHSMTPTWVAQAKALGARVELITNGTTLTEEVSRQLIEGGLDLLWVSIDGASPETFADVRIGANLPQVIENLRHFSRIRPAAHHPKPEIGIAFLAMKRNIADLPEVIRLGKSLKATHFSVSNIQPATADMQDEAVYAQVIRNIAYLEAPHLPRLKIPRMDFDSSTRDALFEAFNSQLNVEFAGNNWSGASDTCNFVEAGTMSVAWNGDVSPCWPLMHTHTSYLHGKPRISRKHVIGNVADRPLAELWMEPEYMAYRERLHNFVFAPCSFCGGCDLSEANEEDCVGNTTFPVCGGCLWAQGIIQCP
jgi:MoaA/NifB/PqqE/SkfB family radical SAM enzyme